MKSNYVINLTSIATEEEKCDILINNLNDVIKHRREVKNGTK